MMTIFKTVEQLAEEGITTLFDPADKSECYAAATGCYKAHISLLIEDIEDALKSLERVKNYPEVAEARSSLNEALKRLEPLIAK